MNSKRQHIQRVTFVGLHDIIMAILAFESAVWVRYEIMGAPQGIFFLWPGTLAFSIVCAITFLWSGLYRGIWHYASLTDLLTIVRATSLSILLFLPVMFITTRLDAFPRSALFLLWPLLIVFLSAPRIFYRLAKDGNLQNILERNIDGRVPILMVGAGSETERFIREVNRPNTSPYRVVGIVDNRPGRIGRDIRGVRIWGTLDSLKRVTEKLGKRGIKPQRLVLTTDKLDPSIVTQILETAEGLGMTVARLPRVTDFGHLDPTFSTIKNMHDQIQPIAMEDLLRRPQQVLDQKAIRTLVRDRRVLVTGAGGTIGSELVRQLIALEPQSICLLDNSEFALYQVDIEISELAPHLTRISVLADVKNYPHLERIFKEQQPDLVLHAAALKHVPLAEDNPVETILTNVMGTRNVARACQEVNTMAMILISTDKAVNPTSIMGATKRIAESYCQALNVRSRKSGRTNLDTRFVVVRFGNVLGSTGSVVPLFQRQLARGGPITVTHRDATRYFMTTHEAVQLILQAFSLPENADAPERIFILDMGDPVKIQDLARQMILMTGLQPEKDIKITYTGLRPGEKIHEDLFHQDETLVETAVPGVKQAAPRPLDLDSLDSHLDQLNSAAQKGDISATIKLLNEQVPEYCSPMTNRLEESGFAND